MFHPQTGAQRLLIDGFSKPNGIAFSSDRNYVYVTDSGYFSGNGYAKASLPRTVYRYRLLHSSGDILAGDRIVFCVVSKWVPDGVKVDPYGRVWVGAGAGLEIFASDGTPLSIVHVPGSVINFDLSGNGGAYVMGEIKLFRLDI